MPLQEGGLMQELRLRVARAIARTDDPRILDGSENGLRLWEAQEYHYLMLAHAALGAVIANSLGELEDAAGWRRVGPELS